MSSVVDKISAAAKARFADIPFPARKDEYWRFADLSLWGVDALFPYFSKAVPSAKPDAFFAEIEKKHSGKNSILLADGRAVCANLPAGAKLYSAEEAAAEFPSQTEDFFNSAKGKFDTLVSTFAPSAVAVKISAGASVEIALAAVSKFSLSASAVLFILGEGSKLRLSREIAVAPETFGLSRAKFILSKNSTLELSTFARSGDNSRAYSRDDFSVSDGAKVVDAYAQLGRAPTRTERNFDIFGSFAEVDTRAFVKCAGGVIHDLRTSQEHRAPSSKSVLAVKAAVEDISKLAFMGLVRVEEIAQKTEAYQSCRSLSLSDKAETRAAPILEIMANDVACSHGCTVSKPDDEEVFYMNQRGLSREASLELITRGFAMTTFERLGIEPEL